MTREEFLAAAPLFKLPTESVDIPDLGTVYIQGLSASARDAFELSISGRPGRLAPAKHVRAQMIVRCVVAEPGGARGVRGRRRRARRRDARGHRGSAVQHRAAALRVHDRRCEDARRRVTGVVMAISGSIQGRDALKATLAALPEVIRDAMGAAIQMTASEMVRAAKARVPVDTGALRDHIAFSFSPIYIRARIGHLGRQSDRQRSQGPRVHCPGLSRRGRISCRRRTTRTWLSLGIAGRMDRCQDASSWDRRSAASKGRWTAAWPPRSAPRWTCSPISDRGYR